MDRVARIHPQTLTSRNSSDADRFEVEGVDYRIVRSESVPLGDVHLIEGSIECVLTLDLVRN